MDWAGNKSARVCYCCVWKDGRVLHTYTIGNHGIDNMAALCLEAIPPYHRFYIESIAAFTFAFFMDHGFVYFAILRHNPGNSHLLGFLQNLRDEFTRIGGRGDQFLPVVSGLVASLEQVGTGVAWPAICNANGGASSSTKAPLLARSDKKKKMTIKDDDGVGVDARDVERAEIRHVEEEEEERRRGLKSSSQNVREKWCRQVRIVVAIDAAVCIVLFAIWLVICRGIQCIR